MKQLDNVTLFEPQDNHASQEAAEYILQANILELPHQFTEEYEHKIRELLSDVRSSQTPCRLELTIHHSPADLFESFLQLILKNTAPTRVAIDLSGQKLDTQFAEILAEIMPQYPQVKALYLTNCKLGPYGAKLLAPGLANIEILDLHGNQLFSEGATTIFSTEDSAEKKFPNLLSLDLGANDIGFARNPLLKSNTLTGIKTISAYLALNPKLQRLFLYENKLSPEALEILSESLKQNQNLQLIDLYSNRLEESKDISEERSLKAKGALSKAHFITNQVRQWLVNQAGGEIYPLKVNGLDLLKVDEAPLKDEAYKIFEKTTGLEPQSKAEPAQETESAVQKEDSLAEIPSVLEEKFEEEVAVVEAEDEEMPEIHIDVAETISKAGSKQYIQRLKIFLGKSTLPDRPYQVNFSNIDIEEEDFEKKFSEFLDVILPEIQAQEIVLSFQNEGLDIRAARIIAEIPNKYPQVVALDLDDSNLGNDSVIEIVTALGTNQSLVALSLNNNQIGLEGAAALGNLLSLNSPLKELNLENNRFAEKAVDELASGLRANTNLQNLNLGFVNINQESRDFLVESLFVSNRARKIVSIAQKTELPLCDIEGLDNPGIDHRNIPELEDEAKDIARHHLSKYVHSFASDVAVKVSGDDEQTVVIDFANLARNLANQEYREDLQRFLEDCIYCSSCQVQLINSPLVIAIDKPLNFILENIHSPKISFDLERGNSFSKLYGTGVRINQFLQSHKGVERKGILTVLEAIERDQQKALAIGSEITPEEAVFVSNLLKRNRNLEKLKFAQDSEMDDQTIAILAEAIKRNTNLTTISIAEDHLSDEAKQVLADALAISNLLRKSQTDVPFVPLNLVRFNGEQIELPEFNRELVLAESRQILESKPTGKVAPASASRAAPQTGKGQG